jgi:hypothetical protein
VPAPARHTLGRAHALGRLHLLRHVLKIWRWVCVHISVRLASR